MPVGLPACCVRLNRVRWFGQDSRRTMDGSNSAMSVGENLSCSIISQVRACSSLRFGYTSQQTMRPVSTPRTTEPSLRDPSRKALSLHEMLQVDAVGSRLVPNMIVSAVAQFAGSAYLW